MKKFLTILAIVVILAACGDNTEGVTPPAAQIRANAAAQTTDTSKDTALEAAKYRYNKRILDDPAFQNMSIPEPGSVKDTVLALEYNAFTTPARPIIGHLKLKDYAGKFA